ncbi:hypothetical protein C471_00730 [Halorubrum saccharovorum DSM 1137]|uniref:Uncharacterized protein n=1 Tax=Halorubrum saccharovorum DSM 1137 TaxID=1227484 RepID=M0E721_9EURY|nr:hypothetical protein [Halorubrum saccharovorum]ELZ43596.1 hypothetical protein C471_00730 [Halorubrum saccharovorum DSM 1137]
MRPRDDPTERRRRRASAQKRYRSHRGTETNLCGRRLRAGGYQALLPIATLAGVVIGGLLVALRATSALLREWSLAIAVLLAVAGCWLCAVAVAHVAATVVARGSGTSR